ncbi:cytochrome P450 [Actinosynnema sp. NPDC020468]|uniref:cytochrome P450 n=1 Tax=Actinosynnema sp. NPDC020468 TaxID=3154488 RepID=UPI0033DEC862
MNLEEAVVGVFNPLRRDDPYPSYAALRAAGPFVPGPMGITLVPGYAECDAILQNPQWSHAEESELLHPDSDVELPGSFLWMEPPDHTRLRGLVSKAFTARTIEGTRSRAVELVDSLVDKALAAGEVNLVDALAYPVPLTLVCELLGVPAADHELIREISGAIARGLDPDALLSQEEKDARTEAVHRFTEYFGALTARRRTEPRDDLVSALAQVHASGDRLTDTELIGTLLILVVAGHETTVNLIANGVLALLRNPSVFAELRANPELAASAADEFLRYDAPVHLTTRTARAEITVSGRTFQPGEAVLLLFGSANRDPRAFAHPDRLVLDRYGVGERVNRHLSFGLGLHYCLGAPLARLEMEVVLRALATRTTSVELLSEPPYLPNLVVRGMSELKVRLS